MEIKNYKLFLKIHIQELKTSNKDINMTGLAEALGIQNTYLSRVLNSEKDHLNQDHIFETGIYLKLSELEFRYLRILHARDTAYLPTRKNFYNNKLKKIKNELLNITKNLETKNLNTSTNIEKLKIYYLNPDYQLIHMFLTIPEYAKEPLKIRNHLAITKSKLTKVFEDLKLMNIIQQNGSEFKVLQEKIHLARTNELFEPYQLLLRQKALEKLYTNNDDYNLSVVFTSSEEVKSQIQQEFLSFIKKVEKLVENSESKKVCQLNFDLFSWMKEDGF